jgi:hypothetical protein
VSTDFVIDTIDKNKVLQISFAYEGSSAMILGSGSDVQVFVYDIGNSVLIPVTPLRTIAGPVNSPKEYVGTFQASGSSNYRLILHIATANASAWDILLDSVIVNDEVNQAQATQVPSVVLKSNPISGAVTDHMVVMWQDGATKWVPATITGAALPTFGSDKTQLGFATNIVGAVADIYIKGYMGGFSFGPFAGFEQYIDNIAGGISPLPSPFTDLYVMVGMAISATELNIQFDTHLDLIANSSGTPLKGALLTSSAVNDGTGDLPLIAGINGAVPFYNSAAALGIQTGPAVVASAPFTYTTSTRTLTAATATNSVAGFLSAADHTTFSAAAPLASPAFTGTPSMPTGTTGVTQTAGNSTTALATTAFVTTADNLKAPLASPALTGVPTAPTAAAATSTTQLATTAFATTADNLKANIASPTFTGTVTLPASNLINGASAGTNTVVVYKDGHIKSTQTTAATATVGTPAGTGATCTLTGGTDSAGSINLTTTATLPTAGVVCTVNFNKAYGVAPHCVTTAISSGAIVNEVTSGVFFTTTTAGLKVNFANSDVTGHTYNYDYLCIETQ